MTQGTGLEAFERRFPDRFYDVGIAEEHAAVFAAGLAIGGMRPVVAVYSTFLQRAFDMLVQDVGLQDLPVIFAVDRAGLVGDDGPTHHGAFDLSYLRVIPGMTVMAPSSQDELQRMLATALTLTARRRSATRAAWRRRSRRPRSSSRSRSAAARCSRRARRRSRRHRHGGRDRRRGGRAAGLGERSPTVVDARFVKPLDRELLEQLATTHRLLVTVEENVLAGGFGGAVLEEVGEPRRGAALRPARRLRAAGRARPRPRRSRAHAAGGRARGRSAEPCADARQVGCRDARAARCAARRPRALPQIPRAGARGGPRRRSLRRRAHGRQARHPGRRFGRDRRRRATPLRLARRRQARHGAHPARR